MTMDRIYNPHQQATTTTHDGNPQPQIASHPRVYHNHQRFNHNYTHQHTHHSMRASPLPTLDESTAVITTAIPATIANIHQDHGIAVRSSNHSRSQSLEPMLQQHCYVHHQHPEQQEVVQSNQLSRQLIDNPALMKPVLLHRPAHPPPPPPQSSHITVNTSSVVRAIQVHPETTAVEKNFNTLETVVPLTQQVVEETLKANMKNTGNSSNGDNYSIQPQQRGPIQSNYYVNTQYRYYSPPTLQSNCFNGYHSNEAQQLTQEFSNQQPLNRDQKQDSHFHREVHQQFDGSNQNSIQSGQDGQVVLMDVHPQQNPDDQDYYTEEVIQAILSAKEALEKPIEERDERDIMLIDHLCSLVHGFDSFPKNVRRALAAQSVLIVIDEKGKELIVHNEELDSFCVLIFGECEQLNVTKTVPIRYYHVGDAFGVCEPTTETIRFVGHMVTRCENCAFLCVKRDEFYSILTDPANYPHEDTIRHRDKHGNVVCVSQFNINKRTSEPLWSHHMQSNNPLKIVLPDGHVIIRATEACLLMALVDGYDRIDPEYVDDFLLLFRVFMTHDQRDKVMKLPPGMINLCLTLTKWLDQANFRDKVVKIILSWLSSYYHDFELDPEFSYLFFKLLESRLSSLSMSNQLHLLHVTLSTKSRIRHVTISRSSREQPLNFSISGGYEKNCGIFVTKVFGLHRTECPETNLMNYLKQSSTNTTPDSSRPVPLVPPRQKTIHSHSSIDFKTIKLKPGDQILEVNGTNFAAIKLVEAQKKLDMSTHLALTVRYNPSAYEEMLALPSGKRKSSQSSIASVSPFLPANGQSRFTFNQLDQIGNNKLALSDPYPPASPLFSANANFGFRSMIKSAAPRNDKSRLTSLINSSKQLVKQIRDTTSQVTGSNVETMSKNSDSVSDDQSNDIDLVKARSNPDLQSTKPARDRPIESSLSSIVRLDDLNPTLTTDPTSTSPEQTLINVLKVYNAANNEHRYILVHEETTAREVVMVAVKEFNLTGTLSQSISPSEKTLSSLDWHLYEVSVVPESKTIKQKCLSEQTSHLAERASLCSRFYIKSNSQSSFGSSKIDMSDDILVSEILKESPPTVNLSSLDPILLAVELTLADFDKFRKIEPQQFVYDTFFNYNEKPQSTSTCDTASLRSSSSDGCDVDPLQAMNKTRSISKSWLQEFHDFADISNREMFWVVCEILDEKSMSERVKIIKQFIRVAYVCERLRNYNSMFAIISGLGHSCVNRLRRTFDKLKTDYRKELDTMRNLFDPSRNMLNYRNCLNQTQPPAIPLFPQIKKDLTFTKEGRAIFVRESNDMSDGEDTTHDTIRRRTRRGDVLTVKSATLEAGSGRNDNLCSNQTSKSFSHSSSTHGSATNPEADSILVNFAEIRQFTDRVRNVIYYSSAPYTKDLLTNTRDSQRNQTQIKKMHEEWQMRKRIRHYIGQTLNCTVGPADSAQVGMKDMRMASSSSMDTIDSGTNSTKQNTSSGKQKLNIIYDERILYQRSLDVEPEMSTRPQFSSNAQTVSQQTHTSSTSSITTATTDKSVEGSSISIQPAIHPSLQTPVNPSQIFIPQLSSLSMQPPSAANSSPTLSKSSSLSSCSSFGHHLPNYQQSRNGLSSSIGKFGTESTDSLRKLQALSENVGDDWRSSNGSSVNKMDAGSKPKGTVTSRIFPPKASGR